MGFCLISLHFLFQQMKHFDKNVPKIHRCISLVYNEIGEERARKILDARASQQAAETSSAQGKAPKANLSFGATTSTPKSVAILFKHECCFINLSLASKLMEP